MHCQSQISIIWNNGVERTHKSKNADKIHPDKLYEQGGHKKKKKEKSGHWSQKRHRCKGVGPGHLTLVLQVLNQALRVGHRPAATALLTLAGSALQSICSRPFGSLPNTVCSPQILIIHVPGSMCTPNHTPTSCLLCPFLDKAKQLSK